MGYVPSVFRARKTPSNQNRTMAAGRGGNDLGIAADSLANPLVISSRHLLKIKEANLVSPSNEMTTDLLQIKPFGHTSWLPDLAIKENYNLRLRRIGPVQVSFSPYSNSFLVVSVWRYRGLC